jgi:hypothetical protein
MQKAHLYEAILLMNRGLDDAVRGPEGLKHEKDSGLNRAHFDEKLTLREVHRALLNGCSRNNVELCEPREEAHFEKRHRLYQKKAFDDVKIYQDGQVVEENRHSPGKAPRVRFFNSEEQPPWERQHPKSPDPSEPRGENENAQED